MPGAVYPLNTFARQVSNSSGWRPSHEAGLEHVNGREIKNPGDGFLATFDSSTRAVRCAYAIRTELSSLGNLSGRLPTGWIANPPQSLCAEKSSAQNPRAGDCFVAEAVAS